MEATLAVLHKGLRNTASLDTKSQDAAFNASATDRQPLQPLGNLQRQSSHPEVCSWLKAHACVFLVFLCITASSTCPYILAFRNPI